MERKRVQLCRTAKYFQRMYLSVLQEILQLDVTHHLGASFFLARLRRSSA